MLQFTCPCPVSAELQAACGVPLGVVVQPLAGLDVTGAACETWAGDLARCTSCGAYISCLAPRVDSAGWVCGLCGCANRFETAAAARRYRGEGALPELEAAVVDAECALVEESEDVEGVDAMLASPAVLALVDMCWEEGGLAAVKSALATALELLPPGTRFGLVSFSSQITWHTAPPGGSSGSVVREPASEAGDSPALDSVLVPVESCREAMLAAVDELRAEPPVGGSRERALGDTLQAVLRWVAAAGAAADGLRLLLFLSGPPNQGPGSVVIPKSSLPSPQDTPELMLDPEHPQLSAWGNPAAARETEAGEEAAQATSSATRAAGDLSHAAPPGVAPSDLVVNLAAAEFYAAAGAAAAALAVTIDVFAACPRYIGVDLIEPLTRASGGRLLLYSSAEAGALPQDVYKCLTPRPSSCLVRVRCSPELRLAGYHGRLTPASEPNLWHMVACGPGDAFALEYDRTEHYDSGAAPVMQVVVQYSVVVPLPHGQGKEEGEVEAGGARFVRRRRIRIITTALSVASTPHAVFEDCDAEAIACLLTHVGLELAEDHGVAAAKQQLRDFVVQLAARAADPDGLLWQQRQGPATVDASLSHFEALHDLPSFAYALLHGPLLQAGPAPAAGARWHAHPEAAAALRAVLPLLPAGEAAAAVQPQLSCWTSPDRLALRHHSLAGAAPALEREPIWCLDSFSLLIVLYTSTPHATVGAPPPPPFPPPTSSLLWSTLARIRRQRQCTPELLLLRQGIDDDSSLFDSLLASRGQAEGTPSLAAFLEAVAADARQLLETGL